MTTGGVENPRNVQNSGTRGPEGSFVHIGRQDATQSSTGETIIGSTQGTQSDLRTVKTRVMVPGKNIGKNSVEAASTVAEETEKILPPAVLSPAVSRMKQVPTIAGDLVPQLMADNEFSPVLLRDPRVVNRLRPLLGLLTRVGRGPGRIKTDGDLPEAAYSGTPEENNRIKRAVRFSSAVRTRARETAGIGATPQLVLPDLSLDNEIADQPIAIIGAGGGGIVAAAALRLVGYKNLLVFTNEPQIFGVWKRGVNPMMDGMRRNNPTEFSFSAPHLGVEAILPRSPGLLEGANAPITLFLDEPPTEGNVTIIHEGQIVRIQPTDTGHEMRIVDPNTSKIYDAFAPKYLNTIGTVADITLPKDVLPQDVEKPRFLDQKNDTANSRWRYNLTDDRALKIRDTSLFHDDVMLVDFGNGKATLIVEPDQDFRKPRGAYDAFAVTDYLREIAGSVPGGLDKHLTLGEVTKIDSDDYHHVISFTTPDGQEKTMDVPIVIRATGLGEPTPLNSPGKMETNATDEDVYGRRQFHIPEAEWRSWDGRNVIIIGAGNSAFEMVPQFQRMQDNDINVDYHVLTHMPREALLNPGCRVELDGKEYEIGRSDANPKGLALELKHIFDAYTRALAEGKLISDVVRWDIVGDTLVVAQADGKVVAIPRDPDKDRILALTGFRYPSEKLEALGMPVLASEHIPADYDGAIHRRPGEEGRRRVKGSFGIGTAMGNRPQSLAGIQDAVADMVPSVVLGSAEYRLACELVEEQREERKPPRKGWLQSLLAPKTVRKDDDPLLQELAEKIRRRTNGDDTAVE